MVGPVGGAQTHQSEWSGQNTRRGKAGKCSHTINVVDEASLAKRVLVLGGRVTEVVTRLWTTDTLVGVDLVGLKTEFRTLDKEQ